MVEWQNLYFWKDKELAERLRRNDITQKYVFSHFFLVFLLGLLAFEYHFLFPSLVHPEGVLASYFPNKYDMMGSLLHIWITIFTVTFCYRININGNNTYYFERLFCLALPIYIRAFVIVIILYVMLLGVFDAFYLWEHMDFKHESETTSLDMSMLVLFDVLVFFRMTKCFRIAAGTRD